MNKVLESITFILAYPTVLPSILESKKYSQNCLDKHIVTNTLCDIPHQTPHYHKFGCFISDLALD
jgi:hypothetical protein